jgi:hypothetical protein
VEVWVSVNGRPGRSRVDKSGLATGHVDGVFPKDVSIRTLGRSSD